MNDIFPQLTVLNLSYCRLNSTDFATLAQAKVKGYLPLLKHLNISGNFTTVSTFKSLFDGPCTWRELLNS